MNIKKFNAMIKKIQEKEDKIEQMSNVDMNEIQMYFDKPIHPVHDMNRDEENFLEGMSL